MDRYTVRIHRNYLSTQALRSYAVDATSAGDAALKSVARLQAEGAQVDLDTIALHVRRRSDKAYSRLRYDQTTRTVQTA